MFGKAAHTAKLLKCLCKNCPKKLNLLPKSL